MATNEGGASADPSFTDHFSCNICLEMLDKPKQCQRNEHHFCESCITQHLARSSTCPVCRDKLTLQTLRAPSRVIVEILSKLKPKCDNAERGCKVAATVEDLVSHHEVCGFSPVRCRNEGCTETVNKQDLPSHENESCKFRKMTCDQCREEMTLVAFEMHPCLMKSEMNGMKLQMNEIKVSLNEMQEQMKAMKTSNYTPMNYESPMSMVLQFFYGLVGKNVNVNQSCLIFVAGGHEESRKSFEVFNWSTKTWTLYEGVLFFNHYGSFCFPYKNSIMVCSPCSGKMEYVDIKNDPHRATAFPGAIKSSYIPGKGVVCEDKVFTFYDNAVNATDLHTPGSPQAKAMLKIRRRCYYGVECFDRKIVFGGGIDQDGCKTDTVEQYDVTNNTIDKLSPLPYGVAYMATVQYKDNIIFIGGQDSSREALSSVFMYNVTTQESTRLPSMLTKRSACAAVMMGEVIVVMGGGCNGEQSNIAEYHVLGQLGWNKLPNMHLSRYRATASVLI